MGGNVKNTLTSFLELAGLAVWVEIATESPRCTYYFGPFISVAEAEAEKLGYVEDLESEGAKITNVNVKRCKKPTELTIYDESLDFSFDRVPSLSGQAL